MQKLQNLELVKASTGDKIGLLRQELIASQPGCLAFSGGLDSRFLASLITRWHLNYLAIFFSGPQITAFEKKFAISFLNWLKLPYRILKIDPLSLDQVAFNSKNRCYFCKKHLFSQASSFAFNLGYPNLIDGSHTSDQNEFRPGQQALFELGVLSPLKTCQFSKEEIRSWSTQFAFYAPNQPSRACLLTRFPYYRHITNKDLNQLAEAEERLYHLGLRDFRIRVLSQEKCCLQIATSEKNYLQISQADLYTMLKRFGWKTIEISFSDNISGYFDQLDRDNK